MCDAGDCSAMLAYSSVGAISGSRGSDSGCVVRSICGAKAVLGHAVPDCCDWRWDACATQRRLMLVWAVKTAAGVRVGGRACGGKQAASRP